MKTLNTLLILLIIAIGNFGYSQSLKKANLLYANRAYVDAAEIFEQLPKTRENLEKLGDCYYFNSEIDKANTVYTQVYNLRDEDSLSIDFYFKYFDVLKSARDYYTADQISVIYLKHPIHTENFKRKIKQVAPFNYSLKLLSKQSFSSSFGVGLFGEKIVFASTKNLESPEYNWNKKPYLDLYEAEVSKDDDPQLRNITTFSKTINSKDQHESSAIFTKDGKTMYFSRNHNKRIEIDSNQVAVVSIFKAELENDDWINVERVSFASERYSTMHPALNSEENRLYFSSDMPSSMGSFDIFYVDILDNGSFGEPINLGAAINTNHREQFPYIATDSTLYFASNGKQGLGGLDIFSSKFEDNSYLEALNIGETINSETDDFAFVVVDSLNTGYISSNREGSDNIYTFKRTPKDRIYFVEGLVTDKRTGALLPNTTVTLFDEVGNRLEEITVGEDGRYRLATKPNQSYQLEGFRPKYIPELKYFDTNDKGNIEFNIELEIESYNDAEEIVNDREDGNTYIELENIYFDFAKWDIKPQAAKTLDILVTLLKKYPRMEIQLGAHTDSRSTFEFNMDLSDKRARATLEYLVENGIPRQRLRSKGYGETKPLVNCGDDCTETEFSINRRCEFLILK